MAEAALFEYFRQLSGRERSVLLAGGAFLVGAVVYVLVVAPLQDRRERLETRVQAQVSALAWLQRASLQVEELRRASRPAGRLPAGTSLISIVDGSAARAGVKPAIRRVVPNNQDGVQVWLEDVGFDPLIGWLVDLHERFGLRIDQVSVTAGRTTGQVRANLILQRPDA